MRADHEIVYTGNYLYGIEATDKDVNVSIRLNEQFRPLLNIKKGRGIRGPFYRLWLTNTAQAGKSITLVMGIEAANFEVIDNLTAITVSGTLEAYEQNLANGWATEGPLTPAGADVLMADTGQLAAGIYDFTIIGHSAGAFDAWYQLQHRNAADAANIKEHAKFLPSYERFASPLFWSGYSMALNERLRIVSSGGTVNETQFSIWFIRRQ